MIVLFVLSLCICIKSLNCSVCVWHSVSLYCITLHVYLLAKMGLNWGAEAVSARIIKTLWLSCTYSLTGKLISTYFSRKLGITSYVFSQKIYKKTHSSHVFVRPPFFIISLSAKVPAKTNKLILVSQCMWSAALEYPSSYG